MSEPEQARLEAQYFADDQMFEQLAAVESELIDRYVRADLTAAERGQFESNFLTNAHRQQQVAQARALLQLFAALPPPPAAPAPHSWWQRLLARFGTGGAALRLSFAAAVLVLLGLGVWFIVQRALAPTPESARTPTTTEQPPPTPRLPQQTTAQQQVAAPQQTTVQPPPPVPATQPGPQATGQATETATAAPHEQSAQPRHARAVQLATYMLSAASVRGGGAGPAPLVLRPEVTRVRFTAYLDENEYPQYHASLQRVTGEEVWAGHVAKGRPTRAGERVQFELPAAVLQHQDYLLYLTAPTTAGSAEATRLGAYAVTVTRPPAPAPRP